MNWTKEKPKKDGWYWERRQNEIDIVYISIESSGRVYRQRFNQFVDGPIIINDVFDEEWYGPLEPPE